MKEPSYNIIRCYNAQVMPKHARRSEYSGSAYICWYICNGSVMVDTADTQICAQEGDWVFIEPLTQKSHAFSANAHIVSLRFSVNWNNLHFFPPLLRPWKAGSNAPPAMLEAATKLCAYAANYSENGQQWPLFAYARHTELFSRWLFHWHTLRDCAAPLQPPNIDPRIINVLSELIRTPGIAPVDYDHLAQITGLSRVHINRLFRQSTGQSIKGWKNSNCLKIAEEMLMRNTYSIKEIAARLGFCDASHFSKWFRLHMHYSPNQWRDMQ